MTVTWADLSRRVSSGGAFGYYDGWPTGDMVQLDGQGNETPIGTISLVSGLANTLKVTQTLNYGASVQFLFGQESSDPTAPPLPNLFDVNLALGTSIDLAGIEIGGFEITADYVTVSIGDSTFTYSHNNLSALTEDLVSLGMPQSSAEIVKDTVSTAMSAITTVQSWAFDFYHSLDTADFSGMQSLVSVDLTSGMASTPDVETTVNIGQKAHVIGTNFGDTIHGTVADNKVSAGAGHDYLFGSKGADILDGGQGMDTLNYAESSAGVTVNFVTGVGIGGDAEGDTVSNFEVIIGSNYADTVSSIGGTVMLFSGMEGDDTFNIRGGSGSPTIVWGGAGSDTVSIQMSQNLDAVGILVVNAANLTEENFHLFDLESLGMGSSFDWSAIDVVLVNPDASDKLEYPS